MTKHTESDLVLKVARAIGDWDQGLVDYMGENPVVERASSIECEKRSQSITAAKSAIAAASPTIEQHTREQVLRDFMEWCGPCELSVSAVISAYAQERHGIDLTQQGEG